MTKTLSCLWRLSLTTALVASPLATLPSLAAPVGAPTMQLKVSAVDANTFHLLAYPTGQATPPASPFIVQTKSWAGATVQNHATASSVTVPSGSFVLDYQGNWEFTGKNGLSLSGAIATSPDKSTITIKHAAGERFYGAGNEKRDFSGPLQHATDSVVVDNGVTRVPYLWSTGGYSLLMANNHKGAAWADQGGTMTWTVPNSYVDAYISVAPNAYGLLDAYSRLTGPAPIPPRWTFGFLASRWGYGSSDEIQDKWHQFRDRQIPVDAFIYDYDWFTNDWDFNTKNFPAGSLTKLHNMGLKFVGIRKPRVNDKNLDFARQKGWVLSSPIGTDLRFDIPEAAYWWWSHQAPLVQAGVDGWWNDEAEQTLDEFFQMSRVQYEGWRAMSPRRAWMINRGFAPGIQRYGASTWTGDTHSSWETLVNQKGIQLNWALAGMPFTSEDTGGFENLRNNAELYTRWVESSVFTPVMRIHCVYNESRWPWDFGPDALAATKKAIELRYRLIPYLYTFAEETSRTGAPIMRPMLLEFPNDPKTFEMRDQWLFGNRLLTAPLMNEGGQRDVYLPAGQWYDFNSNASIPGGQTLHVTAPLDTIPTYVRAGSIIPLGPVIQSTSLGKTDPLEVRVYPGANASFSLYEDDGDNYDYQKGAFTRIPMNWDNTTSTLTIGKRVGSYPGMLTTRNIVAVVPGKATQKVTYTGILLKIKF